MSFSFKTLLLQITIMDMHEMNKGKFIVLEGIDGSGKSTLANGLYKKMLEHGFSCERTFEPTNGHIGQLIRAAFRRELSLSEETIAALFLADRLDHIQNSVSGLIVLLSKGINVICDRYVFSSFAYHVPHVSLEWVIAANSICMDKLTPDLTIYLDLPVEKSMQRLSNSRAHMEIFETEERLKQVSQNYEDVINHFSHSAFKIERIDASLEADQVINNAWHHVFHLLNE
jgi:dTMP kinase